MTTCGNSAFAAALPGYQAREARPAAAAPEWESRLIFERSPQPNISCGFRSPCFGLAEEEEEGKLGTNILSRDFTRLRGGSSKRTHFPVVPPSSRHQVRVTPLATRRIPPPGFPDGGNPSVVATSVAKHFAVASQPISPNPGSIDRRRIPVNNQSRVVRKCRGLACVSWASTLGLPLAAGR